MTFQSTTDKHSQKESHKAAEAKRVNNKVVQEQDCTLALVLVSKSWTLIVSGS